MISTGTSLYLPLTRDTCISVLEVIDVHIGTCFSYSNSVVVHFYKTKTEHEN